MLASALAKHAMDISYHVSHEQFAPRELLKYVQAAEDAGFQCAFSSDHLQPWLTQQGQSGFTWSWLGSALALTNEMKFSAITVPCGWRYHPVVLAHAIATLGQMFPGRLPWIALGSGEAINEFPVSGEWPAKLDRNALLKEGAEIIRALLAGETVTANGPISCRDARIWSRPETGTTRLMAAATSEATAEWAGSWADGLLTIGDPEKVKRIGEAFRRGGGEGKPIHLKLDLSWAASYQQAVENAHLEWRFAAIGGEAAWDLRKPGDFEQAARFVRPEDMTAIVRISDSVAWFEDRLGELEQLGLASVDLHNVGRNQLDFIEAFAPLLSRQAERLKVPPK